MTTRYQASQPAHQRTERSNIQDPKFRHKAISIPMHERPQCTQSPRESANAPDYPLRRPHHLETPATHACALWRSDCPLPTCTQQFMDYFVEGWKLGLRRHGYALRLHALLLFKLFALRCRPYIPMLHQAPPAALGNIVPKFLVPFSMRSSANCARAGPTRI
jgi:hypothetical protein